MKKILAALLIVSVVLSGCGGEKTTEKPVPKTEQVTQQLSAWDIITMPNHPRLAAPVVAVRAFYQSIPTAMVDIAEPDENSSQAILFFQVQF